MNAKAELMMVKFTKAIGLVLLLSACICNAEVTVYPVPIALSLQSSIEESGYNALFNAIRFVSRTKGLDNNVVVKDFGDKWIQPYDASGGKTTKEAFEAVLLAWKNLLPVGSIFLSSDQLEWKIIAPEGVQGTVPTYHKDGLLIVFGHIDEFAAIKDIAKVAAAKAVVDAGARVGWIINASSDAARPQWVAAGIFKWGADYHVCTMDSVAGSAVFSDTEGGPRTAVELAIAAALTPPSPVHVSPVPSPVPSPKGSPRPGSSGHDSLEGFGGARDLVSGDRSGTSVVFDDGTVYNAADFGDDVVPGSSGDGGDDAILGYDPADFADRDVVLENPAGLIFKFAEAGVDYPDQLGLKNNGNTCYQNSLIQAINATDYLKGFLLGRFRAVMQGPVPHYIRKFFATLQRLSDPSMLLQGDKSERGYLNPMPFCAGISQTFPLQFPLGRQQDAVEFLQALVDSLQREGIIPGAGNQERFDDGFHGVAEQERMRCLVCAMTKEELPARLSPPLPTHTFLFSLALPPAGGDMVSIEDLFTYYSRTELLKGVQRVDCPVCKKRTLHSKQKFFTIHPEQQFLVLQVNRFQFDPTTLTRLKLMPGITFPAGGVFTIKDSAEIEHRFRVASVVVQSGTLDGGHYWAVSRQGVFNDKQVTIDDGATMEVLLATGLHETGGWHNGTGYLYFLERVEEVANEEKGGMASLVAQPDVVPVEDADDGDDDED